MDDWTKRAMNTYAEDLFAIEATGVVLEQAGPDYARCTLRLERRHRNAAGQVMGGVLFTLADFAFAVAANGPEIKAPTVTLESKIQFLSAPRGGSLTAETNCLKSGRSTCVMEIRITDDTGALCAVVLTTGYRTSSKRETE